MTISKVLWMSEKHDWETPQHLFDELNGEFNFTIDVCADKLNHKCKRYYDNTSDGLWQDWAGETVWCNPPYDNIKEWLAKAVNSNCLTVMLIPSRTDTKWFHEYIYKKYEIRFLKGRLKFSNSSNSAPFPSMIIVIDNITEK